MSTNQDYYEFERGEVPVDGWEQLVWETVVQREEVASAVIDGDQVFSFVFPNSEALALSGAQGVLVTRFSADNGGSVEGEEFADPFTGADRYDGEQENYARVMCAVGFWVELGLEVGDLPVWVLSGAAIDRMLQDDVRSLKRGYFGRFSTQHRAGIEALCAHKLAAAELAYALPANDTVKEVA